MLQLRVKCTVEGRSMLQLRVTYGKTCVEAESSSLQLKTGILISNQQSLSGWGDTHNSLRESVLGLYCVPLQIRQLQVLLCPTAPGQTHHDHRKVLPAAIVRNVHADREMLQLTYSNISEDCMNLTKWPGVLMVSDTSSSSHACRWPGESV